LSVARSSDCRQGLGSPSPASAGWTGSRVLLVCHTPQIPARLAAVPAGTGHQLLTGLPQALNPRGTHPHPRLWPDAAAGAGPDVADLPRFLYPHIRNYRSKAFDKLGPAGFARTDAVYRHGRDAACRWLNTHPGPGPSVASQQSVQLFLAWLVHDSPSRRHTLARLRGAQAGFRLHGFRLDVPPSERVLDVLSGPGLNAPLVTQRATAGSLRQRLDTARAAITRLRAENRSLRDQLARQLGLQRTQHAKDTPGEPS
jgi:hypothetical protein